MPDTLTSDPNSALIDWSLAPSMDGRDFHNVGGQEWRYNEQGVYLKANPAAPLRTPNAPNTVTAILAAYGRDIFDASLAHQIPPELIVMTIAAETAQWKNANFTGPGTFRWEAKIGTYSAGPMQVLETTARSVISRLNLNIEPPPRFLHKPQGIPSSNPLYEGEICIPLGTGLIRLSINPTGLDPIKVAAAYNAGSLGHTTPSMDNPWGLVSTGDHLNRAAEWYGDACFALSHMRSGTKLDVGGLIQKPAIDLSDNIPTKFIVRRNLTADEKDQQETDYRDSGATITEIPEEGGFFTLAIQYGDNISDPNLPNNTKKTTNNVIPPDIMGFVICIERSAIQKRKDNNLRRTVGAYQAFFNKIPVAEISGTAVERPGPGDNSLKGRADKVRIAAGTYPLFTHKGRRNKYQTFGFANPGGPNIHPWPAIRVGNTSSRDGVLIHCAHGFLMSVGCINLSSGNLSKPADNIEFFDSRKRVIDLINSIQAATGTDFPSQNNAKIPNAFLIIRGEP